MSPFSKVEMSPFVILKLKLQHERYGAGGAPPTHEPTRTDAAGSNPTSQAQETKTTSGSGVVVALSAADKTSLQSVSARGRCGTDFETTWPAWQQSHTGKDDQQSATVITCSLL